MRLTFHGGAGEVTGANYLLESGGYKILIDCGLIQGSHYAEKMNFQPFPYDVGEIKAVFITHAHIDHTGRLPKLVSDGFNGKIFSTFPTRDFAGYLLEDSVDILAREAEKHKLPPFNTPDAIDKMMSLWEGVEYGNPFKVGPFSIKFHNAGHILGSAFIEIEAEGKKIVFSGDLGNAPAHLIPDRENLTVEADYCLIESAYGNRVHDPSTLMKGALEDVIEDTVKQGGTLMIPAFAMERTQALLFHINELMEGLRIPKIPVFLDSPLAIKLTDVYNKYTDYLNDETKQFVKTGHKLFNFPYLTMTLDRKESREIINVPPPKIVIAGSGMSQGGRIVFHEQNYLPDPKSTILFAGYQVKGSLGRRILEGIEESRINGREFSVKIMGKQVPVRARAVEVSGYSAHADQPQLLDWLRPARFYIKQAFVVQGEEDQSVPLAHRIKDELAVSARMPEPGEVFDF